MMVFMTESNKIVPERVFQLRERLYGSQQNLINAWLERFGYAPHQTQISGIERGQKGLSLERLRQLAELLETNTDYLLGMTDDDKPASDLDEQVVFSVRNEDEKRILGTIGKEFLRMSTADQKLLLELVERLSGNKSPRIIE